MNAPLFFIALLPDEGIQQEITRFKEYAARHFRSSRALRSPPHITLIPPFRWPEARAVELDAALESFVLKEQPFRLGLQNFNCFAPRVIFVDVERTTELQALQYRLETCLTEELGLEAKSRRDFNPHVTVAFKDLHRKVFPEAWAYFSRLNYERVVQVQALALLEHTGKRWEVRREFGFGE